MSEIENNDPQSKHGSICSNSMHSLQNAFEGEEKVGVKS